MKIAIRMDDIVPDMDWHRFLRVKEILDGYGICPLIGVVPDNRDEHLKSDHRAPSDGEPEDFWAYIKKLQDDGWCVAQHGTRHRYTQNKGGLFPLNHLSEFAGLPFKEQLVLLEEGKEKLEKQGIITDIFMAPAHSYDKNTLAALKYLGFRAVTDGFGQAPYRRAGLIFYPISFRLENSLKKKHGVTTMVLHSNTMEENDFQRLCRVMESRLVISYAYYLRIKPCGRQLPGHAAEYLMAAVKRFLVNRRGK